MAGLPPRDDAPELTHLLYLQRNVVSRRQALRHLTPAALKHRLSSGRWRSVHRAVYVATNEESLNPEQRLWVASLAAGAGRPAVLGGLSALTVLGLKRATDERVHVLLRPGQQDRDPPGFVRLHRTRHLPDGDVLWVRLPPCTRPARSVVDAAQWARSDEQARAIVAAAFHQRLVAGDAVHRAVQRLARIKRRQVITTAADDAALGAHTVTESEFLRLCRRCGLPTPALQVRRVDGSDRIRYLDALFEEWGVHVEIDGGYHTDPAEWWADMKRQNDLWIPGGRVLRFPGWVVRDRPQEVADQVRAALIAAGWRPA